MYKRNIEARSRNHCRRGRAISIVYSECVSVAFVIQDAMRMRRITFVIRGLSGSTLFSHIISKRARYSKKKTLKIIKCVYHIFPKYFSL